MAKFFFHFRQGKTTIIDEYGLEFPTFKDAYVLAMQYLLVNLSEALADGYQIADESMVVCNDRAEVMMTIPIAHVQYMLE